MGLSCTGGVLIAESLRVGARLTGVPLQITELTRVEMTSTGVDQPRYRTLLYFTAAESEAPRPAVELATCLAPTGGWYTDFRTAGPTSGSELILHARDADA